MNIQTVRDNLLNTIAGKEDLLKRAQTTQKGMIYSPQGTGGYSQETLCNAGLSSVIEYLEVNIRELKRILQDVEQCIRVEA